MKKKKKYIDYSKNIYDVFKNIIDTENKLSCITDLIKPDINFAKSFNYDYLYKQLNSFDKNIFNNLIRFIPEHLKDIDTINNFILKNIIIKQINYFINKYENFAKKYLTNQIYNVDTNGIYNYKDFIMLIKDYDCVPFWNEYTEKLSKEIFLPTKNNLEQIEPYETFNYKNWFESKHYIDCSDVINKNLEISKQRQFVKQVKNKKTGKMDNIIKSHKIKLFLNSRQRDCIKRLFGAYRYFYNRTINYINKYDKNTKKTYYFIDIKAPNTKIELDLSKEEYIFTFFGIRRLIKKNYPKWINDLDMPSHLIDMAIKEAIENYQKCLKKLTKYRTKFTLGLKTKKDKYHTMNIEKTMIKSESNSLFSNLKDNKLYAEKYVFRNLRTSCQFNKYLNICDSSITYNQRTNEFYINLNFEDTKIPNKDILKNKKVCSIDPGIKNFAVVYSHNSVDKIGIGVRDKIEKICRDIDIIVSKKDTKIKDKNNKTIFKYNYEKRRNLRKVYHRKIKYLENLKEELHNKTIKYLCDNFGKIIIPPFEIQKMVNNNKTDSRTSRSLMNMSYYKFLSKLKNRCIEYDIEIVVRPEYYTSKTCTRCGHIKHDLKNNDIYNCKYCGLKIERDINGARNIMLRNII
jgi:IS605 OrfB family transposase